MKLAHTLAHEFHRSVRERGWHYVNAVRIHEGSATAVTARVKGSDDYEVRLELDGDKLKCECECPYFENLDPCKHLWATILVADQRDYLSAALEQPRLKLAPEITTVHDRLPEPPAVKWDLKPVAMPPRPPAIPQWRTELLEIENSGRLAFYNHTPWIPGRQILYVVDSAASVAAGEVVVHLSTRDPSKRGGWNKVKNFRIVRGEISAITDPADRHIVELLAGARQREWSYMSGAYEELASAYQLTATPARAVIPLLCATGRFSLRLDDHEYGPLEWDGGPEWQLALEGSVKAGGACKFEPVLRRGDGRLSNTDVKLVVPGVVFTDRLAAALGEDARPEWIQFLRRRRSLEASREDSGLLVSELVSRSGAPPVSLPRELNFGEVRLPCQPCLRLSGDRRAPAELLYRYGEWLLSGDDRLRAHFDPARREFLIRDTAAEKAAWSRLMELGGRPAKPDSEDEPTTWSLPPNQTGHIVGTLLAEGWHVEADGRGFRTGGDMRLEVSSGIDWFDLHAEIDFGPVSAKLPRLLEALRRGSAVVELDDGTLGLLPEEWLTQLARFATMGGQEGGALRFRRNQAGLLDALLAAQPRVKADETFERARAALKRFERVETAPQPDGFVGHLRDYQRDGVGWMSFLREFGFGGCLADDMGVGKTAQVLAMLEARRAEREQAVNGAAPEPPSLVVVPRSLVFNWLEEAARFTPGLKMLDYTGPQRNGDVFHDYDVVLSTYGTLRRDAAKFAVTEFDYVILDEAQAIKNAASESAKAARLLRARHRLALSGTPVENHLGELWSLFEFLNPGMLGSTSAFRTAGGALRNPDEQTRVLLARALRPFILRRTKKQVARELPERTEQTIWCEMDAKQRKLYDELRQHYRDSLLDRISRQGMAKSKMHVLEALLRLRQAACHPGLLDAKRADAPSAKLETLREQLAEVLDEGHKVLVFSQFTSLLALVKKQLDADKITYEYLDGATRDRQKCVQRFQEDKSCPVFLISLKAGGLGLNLTAAEYVFLLDPWWNPAVEAQAIDRAHRIGQTRPVFAYRLITKETVEEKVLQLQQSKRELASAIIGEDNSLIRGMKREDLELLLS